MQKDMALLIKIIDYLTAGRYIEFSRSAYAGRTT